MTERGGRLITIVGQSGSGKTTQMKELVQKGGFRQSVNITTREPRNTDLPNEYNYVDLEEYNRLRAKPGRLLWDVVTGSGAHYSKDVCDLIDAFTDPDNIYVNALVPDKANQLVRKYGSELVRAVLLPSPGDNLLLNRMIDRGDSRENAAERLSVDTDEDWLTQSLTIEGLYVVKGITVAERHEEIVDFALS